ncbi:MAG: RnfABCDGE type electron transport complex subunit A [Candidatus Krumholzibacteria bacterium]|nr:RnfABCDGE type electron transport complex subunit A [Candidatus Krumholzibacteria bacterium]
MELFGIFLTAALINNFVLSQFLGICPFIGVSGKLSAATSMGMATTFVLVMAAMVTFLIQQYILAPLGLDFLQTVSFILVIASLVQFVEMVIKKVSKPLYRSLGIYLPLITTNCAIMGLCLFAAMRHYSFFQSLVFALGAGVGFTLAIVLMAGIREELELADIPRSLRGAGITMVVAGTLALGFMGFAGMKF